MAEPLILAYGRGELPEFPASADTIVDIVPVDHVVSAIVAVLAHPPEPAEVGYFHVSSGDRNPLTFNVLYSSVRTYFDHHPFTAGDRGAARLPEWRFPGARSVERLLSTSEKAWKVADYMVGHAPAQRPRPRPGPQAAPAGPAAGVPAPLPRPLHGVRHRRAALLRQEDDGALHLAVGRGPGDVRLRHLGGRLAALLHRRALPRGHRAGAPPRRAPGAAQEAGPRPAAGRRLRWRRHRGVLRHGRHAALLQRDRDLPLGAAARARRRRAAGRARPDRVQGPEPGAGRAPLAQRLPARHLPRVRRRPGRRPRRRGRRAPHRPHPVPALARRRTPDPRAPRRRPPDGADHRRHPAADPRRCARSSTTSRRPTSRSTTAGSAPATWPPRRWSGSRGPPGCSPTPPSTAST